MMYTYRATVLRWVDGDTVDLDVDLGFTVRMKDRFRLFGVDTPERGRPGFGEATEFAEKHVPVGSETVINTLKDRRGKFGRYLVNIPVGDSTISAMLIAEGLGRPYDGGAR